MSVQFLTRFPMPISCDVNKNSLKWALRFFPFAGLLIGVFINSVYLIFGGLLPESILTLAILTAWVYATGGLHLDGWMDVADAVGSNTSIEKKYEIMKDSRVGSFAVIAVIFLFIWKAGFVFELVTTIEKEQIVMAFLFIPALSRFQALLQLYAFPPIKKAGLAYEWKKDLSKLDIIIAFIWLVLLIMFNYYLVVLLVMQFVFSYFYGKWALKQFKGMNGDLVGTSIEGAELWNLCILYILSLYVMG